MPAKTNHLPVSYAVDESVGSTGTNDDTLASASVSMTHRFADLRFC